MRFAVVIASRGRPQSAQNTVTSVRSHAGSTNDIECFVAVDDDDAQSCAFTFEGAKKVISARPLGPGACWNRCVRLTDAEVFVALADDVTIETYCWDDVIASVIATQPPELGVMAWHDPASPGQATQIIAHRKWIEAVGHIYDDRFPFWFGDTAVNETYSFVTGKFIPLPMPLTLGHSGVGSNPRLRDMDLWWRFYAATRTERLETAARIREQLGLPEPEDLPNFIRGWRARDMVGLPASQEIVKNLANPEEPGPLYRQAEAKARAYLADHAAPAKQSICLSMIVKNESKVIRRCLDSVKPLIDHWCIVDTGSTDGTQAIITEHMAGIPGALLEEPWQDFGTNRTSALAHARKTGCDYILVIDADDTLCIEDGFTLPWLDFDSFAIPITDGDTSFLRPQLLKAVTPWFYKGVVHEHIWRDGGTTECAVLPGLSMKIGNDGARRRDPEVFLQDAVLLRRALAGESDPTWQARYTYFLGQSYKGANRPEEAIHWYLKRADMGGLRDEVYISLLSAARMMIGDGRPEPEIYATLERAGRVAATQ